jgi:hypothetical protein
MVENPGADLEQFRAPAMGRVNKTFDMLPEAITARMGRMGMRDAAQDGGLINKLKEIDYQRAGALASLENQFNELAIGRKDQGMNNLFNMFSMDMERTSTGQLPGNAAAGALSGGISGGVMGTMLRDFGGFGGGGQAIPTPQRIGNVPGFMPQLRRGY